MHRLEGEAHGLVGRLPDLLVEAMRVSNTIAHGIHGRRRPGPGETFWQFRQYEQTDSAHQIDWRRSASSDHLYIREREWEAAHTFWLWANTSASMDFRSDLSATPKRDRAIVLLLAAAELLVSGGERVALLGLTRPSASRHTSRRMAETLAASMDLPAMQRSLPQSERLARFSGVVLISDFLDPPDEIASTIEKLAGNNVTGHLIQVLDPAEETLPYDGRAEFLSPAGGQRWLADRVETLRDAYLAKFASHRAAVTEHARRLGWNVIVHHTDRSATEPLLNLIVRLQNSGRGALASRAGGLA
ncbi:MAG: DUF58 domain-containing protein [Hyphomicrobiaceae bacterium]|nr:DUF58 domain-containing protein [Hyphomicrobiaceae bacterium]